MNRKIDTSSVLSILSICDKQWSSQVHDVICATVVNCFWSIWLCRNKLRFDDMKLNLQTVLNSISLNVSLTGNFSKGCSSSDINEFSILKSFAVSIKPRNPVVIREVLWLPPPCHWIKCNTDGATRGSPGYATCGGIFRDRSGASMGVLLLILELITL